jgi:cysteine-rich repeat protein
MLVLVAACSGEPNAPTCGDGVQDPNEACDDGNRESGDSCTSSCRIPGTLLECTTLLEGFLGDDLHDVLSLSDLSFVVAGENDGDGWIGRYDESGSPLWLVPTADTPKPLWDIAPDSADGYWALHVAGGSDEELIHLDASGRVDTRLLVSDLVQPAGFSVSALRLVVDRDVWLAGTHGQDLWVGRFDVETHVISTVLTEDYAGFYDTAWAIAGSESEIAVAATVETSARWDDDVGLIPLSDVLVIRFDLQGQEVGRQVFKAADPQVATEANSIAADGKGGWIVGGDQHGTAIFSGPQNAWLARVHPSEGWTWANSDGIVLEDIMVAGREIVAVGFAYDDDGARYWLMGLGLDGGLHWEQIFEEPGFRGAEVRAVALDHGNRIRTVNRALNSHLENDPTLLRSCLFAW